MSTSSPSGLANPGGSQWDRLEWDLRTKNITDHEGNTVNLLWSVPPGLQTSADYAGPFPFPIYFTKGAVHSANDDRFRSGFVRLIEDPRNLPANPIVICSRFEFYTKPFPNILACIAHQRREISHRNRNGVFPRLISDWSEGGGDHEGVILVVDRDDCPSSGVILVHFDAEAYKLGRRDERWYLPDDIPEVEAIRHPIEIGQTGRGLAWELESCYRQAGGTWTEDDLQRRNDGAASPVLYPAIDPDAHHDVEHEAAHELDGTALRPPGDTAENEGEDEDEDDDGPAKIIDLFDRRELFMRDTDLPHLASEAYSDLFDQSVTSVWDRRISKTRPDFCFTLYLSYDVLPLRPKALFTCLNKGLLADSAWTLDVVTNLPSLEATFDYHSRNATLRSPAKSKSRASCVRLILDRINGKRLPAELLDLIEHQLVPPEIPNYSSRPLRPHQNLFMYLDHGHLSTGPLLIYSKQMDLRLGRNIRHLLHNSEESADLDQHPLRILFLRFWHRVADELHNLWSTCSPRFPLPEDKTPTISLRITLFNLARWQELVIGEPGETTATTHAHVALRSDFHRPITIHLHPLFSHDLFSEALDLIDLSSGQTLPLLPPPRSSHDKSDSWQQNRALGFHRGISPENHSMNTLHPGKWERILFESDPERTERWIPECRDAGLLREGQENALRLRDNVTIPRWTCGAVEEREGPYNLPPLRVRMDGDVEFKYEGEAVLTDREGVDGPTALSQG